MTWWAEHTWILQFGIGFMVGYIVAVVAQLTGQGGE